MPLLTFVSRLILTPWTVVIVHRDLYNFRKMSARTCQLCGKPLGRIRVGAGEDFCSREHRNQYRLRQGMDRLHEANKVASVMRRREQLRPLASPQPGGPATAGRRGFFTASFSSAPHPAAAPGAVVGPPRPRAFLGAGRFLQPHAVAGPDTAAKPAAHRRFPARPGERMALRFRLSARVPQAPGARMRLARGPESRRREFSRLPSPGLQIQWSRRSRAPRQPALPLDATRLRGLGAEMAAARGNALRVSLAFAFRARPRPRIFPVRRPAAETILCWRETPPRQDPSPPPAAARKVCGSLSIPFGGVFCPPPPEHSGLQPLGRRVPSQGPPPIQHGAALEARGTGARWTASNESTVLPRTVFQAAQAAGYRSLPHIAIRPAAVTGASESRHSLAPFVPQDVGYSFNVGQNGSKDQKR